MGLRTDSSSPGDDPVSPALNARPPSQELHASGRGPGSESALSAVCSRRLLYARTGILDAVIAETAILEAALANDLTLEFDPVQSREHR